jgi:hypothetical protein
MVPSPAPREYLEAVAGGPMMGMQLCFIQGARAVSSGMKSRWSSCIHSNRGAGGCWAVGVAAVLVWLSKGGVGERSRLQKSQWPSSAEPKFTLPSNISQNLNCSTALQSD